MLSLRDRPVTLCDGVSRRELLRVGGLGILGLSLPQLLQAREATLPGVPSTDDTFGRAKNVIFLYLAGGPPQHETFDPKPHAPAEIRGEFKPISTNIPGIHFCELLPRTARIADKLAIVRSMATDDNTHSSSSHWVLTGYKYQGSNARTIQPTDWPYFGSILKKLKPSETLAPLSTVWIPDVMRLNENVTPAGQTGGFLGSQWTPDCFVGNPFDTNYQVEGLRLGELSPLRLQQRHSLLAQIERHLSLQEKTDTVRAFDQFHQQAFELLTSGRARDAFAIQKEPDRVRQRYGRNQWGQCVLLARRLIEAGVRLVHVQWPREAGDNAVDNPLWDTHAQNADRLEDVLCPQFDVGFTALVEDLDQRGLLEETLVVAIGEFGRTPKINGKAGRDHWGPGFSFAMAGAGIRGGQVFGASDRNGAYPARDRVHPGDLTATIFHLVGLHHQGTFIDRSGRPHPLTGGEPMFQLLGTAPTQQRRIVSDGDLARVPPFDPARILTNVDFAQSKSLRSFEGPSRPKDWRASPIVASDDDNKFGVKLVSPDESPVRDGGRHIEIGFGLGDRSSLVKIDRDAQAILAQEVRSPMAGTYHFVIRARGEATSRDGFDRVFLKQFRCQLVLFQFTDRKKSPAQRKVLISNQFTPAFADPAEGDYAEYEVTGEFFNPNAGANFSFGLGMGVAVVVENHSGGDIELSAGDEAARAAIRIQSVRLTFVGKTRNEDVKV